jgi:ParB family transcriptional regulator, chromosome partitioning protein
MATRNALGRGLSALISNAGTPPPAEPAAERPAASAARGADSEPEPDAAPLYIRVAQIAPNPEQPRKEFRPGELASLAQSIREHGILQPLVVRRRGSGYELIIGERRWRASQLAGLDQLPAVVLDATDRQVIEMALVENVQRAELNPIELAQAFRVLVEDEGMTQEEVGRRVGLERSTVANHLRLLELDPDLQQDVVDQKLTMGHAKALLQAAAALRPVLREQIVRQGLSVRATEELARKATSPGSGGTRSRPGPSRDVHVVAVEDRLRRALQTKVRVVGRAGRGRIELPYFSDADLERIVERLLGSELR